jgi:hypothetical protein
MNFALGNDLIKLMYGGNNLGFLHYFYEYLSISDNDLHVVANLSMVSLS